MKATEFISELWTNKTFPNYVIGGSFGNTNIRVRGGAPERLLGTLLSEFFLLLLFVLRGSRARPALPLKLKRKGAWGRRPRDPRPATRLTRPPTRDPPDPAPDPPAPTCPAHPVQITVKIILK